MVAAATTTGATGVTSSSTPTASHPTRTGSTTTFVYGRPAIDSSADRADPEKTSDAWYFGIPAIAQLAEEPLVLDAAVTVIVGENGSGKSTLLEAVAAAWAARLAGAVKHWAPRARRRGQRPATGHYGWTTSTPDRRVDVSCGPRPCTSCSPRLTAARHTRRSAVRSTRGRTANRFWRSCAHAIPSAGCSFSTNPKPRCRSVRACS